MIGASACRQAVDHQLLCLTGSERAGRGDADRGGVAAAAGPVSNFVRGTDCRHQMTNLSPKIMANWVFASVHSRGGRFHSSAA